MREPNEIQRQIEGLERQRESLPEFSFFGDNNWKQIDIQIDILKGDSSSEDFDYLHDDFDENHQLISAIDEAEYWLTGAMEEDLFDEE